MEGKRWLQRGYQLPDESRIGNLVFGSDELQIFSTSYDSPTLVVKEILLGRWIKQDIISDTLFGRMDLPGEALYIFVSQPGYLISSIQNGPFPNTSLDARAFGAALRETRKILPDVSLYDAIYIEQISRLLPTYTTAERVDDKIVLGTWLSGGVKISTDDFERLVKLVGWMDTRDLAMTIASAGFDVPDGGHYLTPQKPQSKDNQDSRNDENAKGYPRTEPKSYRFKLPGRPFLEEFFNENVIDIILNEEKYLAMGIDFPSAIVLHGPPGCGKTYVVEKLAKFIGWPSYSIDSSTVASPYIHDTSKKVAEVFDHAIENSPSIVIIDEMEAYLTDRGAGQSSGLHHVEEVAEFLRRIPEAIKNRVLVIAMTNKIDMIDPAIIRRGRFDHVIEIQMPSYDEVSTLISTLLGKLPVSSDVDIDFMARTLTGRPLSDVAFAIREAGRISVKNDKSEIDNESILQALQKVDRQSKKETGKIGFI